MSNEAHTKAFIEAFSEAINAMVAFIEDSLPDGPRKAKTVRLLKTAETEGIITVATYGFKAPDPEAVPDEGPIDSEAHIPYFGEGDVATAPVKDFGKGGKDVSEW